MPCQGCNKDCKCSFQECGVKCDCCPHCKCHKKVSHHGHCPKGHAHDEEEKGHSHCHEGHPHDETCH